MPADSILSRAVFGRGKVARREFSSPIAWLAGLRRRRFVLSTVSFLTIAALTFWQVQPYANPSEGQVVRGMVDFEDLDGRLSIRQHSGTAVIDWEGFSIGDNEITEFIQPGSKSAALNRVRGGGTSIINGQLTANGRVFLLNPNGVVIGQNGRIDVGGFVASTLDLDIDEFERGGDLNFNGGSQAAIVNLGQIGASDGDIFLVAATVRNLGALNAPDGTVGLAAGNNVLIKADGEERVFVKGAAGAHGVGVDNQGTIQAQVAELKAHGGNVYALAIRNEGRVAATTLSNEGGRVYLRASGGKIRNNGQVVARGPAGTGGRVEMTAGAGPLSEVEIGEAGEVNAGSESGPGGEVAIRARVIQMRPGSSIRANGATDGGTVDLGANPDALTPGEEASTRIDIPAGATVQASGSGGAGGAVSIQGGVASELRLGGEVRAKGALGDGGSISLRGDDIRIYEGGLVDAAGEVSGGTISLDAKTARVDGEIRALGKTGDGGIINVVVEEKLSVGETGILNATSEVNGGQIVISAADEAIVNIAGQLLAAGRTGDGGAITIDGAKEIKVAATGFLDASGARNGGTVSLTANGTIDFQGTALASGASGNGGAITFAGDEGVVVGLGALLDAGGGANGGAISVSSASGSVDFQGTALATGGTGDGGSISVSGAEGATIGAGALLDAGGGANGGSILVDGGSGITDFQGTALATGGTGIGGTIGVAGDTINVAGSASVDASGATGGGSIAIGGPDSRNVSVAPGASLIANATESGGGGGVTLGGSERLDFQGQISASGIATGGTASLSGQARIDLNDLANRVNLSAAAAGRLVVDSDEINVVGGDQVDSDSITGQSIAAWLDRSGSLELRARGGNISISSAADLSWSSGARLTFDASGNLTMESGAAIDGGQTGRIWILAAGDVAIHTGASLSAGSIAIEAGDQLTFAATARAMENDGAGGLIDLLGREVRIEGSARIDASGTAGGGMIHIGGGVRGQDENLKNAANTVVDAGAVIRADATETETGDGGRVVVFAENRLDFGGNVSASAGAAAGDGGWIELSGKREIFIGDLVGQVDLSAANGRAGMLLLDPATIGVIDGDSTGGIAGATVNDQALIDALGAMSVTLTSDTGDITVDGAANVTWAGGNSLTFESAQDLLINAGAVIDATGDGWITANAIGNVTVNGTVRTNTGDITIDANTLSLGATASIVSAANLNTAPRTPGATMGIGDGAPGEMNLTSAEFSLISAANLNLGNLTTGDIAVNGPISYNGGNLNITTGAALNIAGQLGGLANLFLDATDINLAGDVTPAGGLAIASFNTITTTGVVTIGGAGVTVFGDIDTGGEDLIVNSSAGIDLLGNTIVGQGALSVTGGGILDLTRVTANSLNVTGLAGPDLMLLNGVPNFLFVDGSGGFDTVDFGSAAAGVSVKLDDFLDVEDLNGSPNFDTLKGTVQADQFTVTAANSGIVNGISFNSFENLSGGQDDDTFVFANQASVDGLVDGEEDIFGDTLVVDDTNLIANENYAITSLGDGVFRAERNPMYDFLGIENLTLLLGSGDDHVYTDFFSFDQHFAGSAGANQLIVAGLFYDDSSSPLTDPMTGPPPDPFCDPFFDPFCDPFFDPFPDPPMSGGMISFTDFSLPPPPPTEEPPPTGDPRPTEDPPPTEEPPATAPPAQPSSPPNSPPPAPLASSPPPPQPPPDAPGAGSEPIVTQEVQTEVVNQLSSITQVDAGDQPADGGGGGTTTMDSGAPGGEDSGESTTPGASSPEQLIGQTDGGGDPYNSGAGSPAPTGLTPVAAGDSGLMGADVPGQPPASVTPGEGSGPVSMGGGPPPSTQAQGTMQQSTNPQTASAMSEAMGGDGSIGATSGDGAVSADPGDPTPPSPQTEATLGAGSGAGAESELSFAIGGDGSVGVTSGSGPSAITAGGPPPSQGAQQSMSQSTSPRTASVMSQALGGDGTAPVEAGNGATGVDPHSPPPNQETQSTMESSVSAGGESELLVALGGDGEVSLNPGGGIATMGAGGTPPSQGVQTVMSGSISARIESGMTGAMGGAPSGIASAADGAMGADFGGVPPAPETQNTLVEGGSEASYNEMAEALAAQPGAN